MSDFFDQTMHSEAFDQAADFPPALVRQQNMQVSAAQATGN
jgi:hypothetical protein